MELPSERSTSARIDSNEAVEVNEENNDGEGDDECALLLVVLVLVGGGGHVIEGASCFVRLGVLIIMMLSGCLWKCASVVLNCCREDYGCRCAAGGDLKVCLLPRRWFATATLPTHDKNFLVFCVCVRPWSDRSCVA